MITMLFMTNEHGKGCAVLLVTNDNEEEHKGPQCSSSLMTRRGRGECSVVND